jgi:hypothetical protein
MNRRAPRRLVAWLLAAGLWGGCHAEHVVGSLGLGDVRQYPQPELSTIVVGDFNADSHTDVVSQARDGQTVCLFLGNGDGSLQTPRCQTLASSSQLLTVQKQRSGPTWLVRAASDLVRWSLTSDGTWKVMDQTALGAPAQALLSADVDEDGLDDVLVGEAASIEVFQASDSSLRRAGRYVIPSSPLRLLHDDLNGDHRPELAVLLSDQLLVWGQAGQAAWSGCGAGPQFARPIGPWLVSRWKGVLPGLLVFDGSLGLLRVIRAISGAGFQFACGEVALLPAVSTDTATQVTGATSDLDGDGFSELLVVSSDGVLRVMRGSDGSLAPLTERALGTAVSSLQVADLDHDDRPEVIAVSARHDALLVVPNLFRR